jgi:RecB family endonuclease NucS
MKNIELFKVWLDEENGSDFRTIQSRIANCRTVESYEKDLKNSMVSQIDELFPEYKIFGENNEGVEYPIDGKRIDILLEKSNGTLLAIELKPGIANYKVFGQTSMYLGLLMEKFPQREVRGCIVAGEIDSTLKSAAKTTSMIKLKTYKLKDEE